MNNKQKSQNARVRCVLHSGRKAYRLGGVLSKKYTKIGSNENDCYLHSETFFCILNSIKSNNSNKNNELQGCFRMQENESVGVLHSDAKPVTTGVIALFSECCAPPIYLRYICKTQRLHLGFTFTDIRYVSGGRGCDR